MQNVRITRVKSNYCAIHGKELKDKGWGLSHWLYKDEKTGKHVFCRGGR